MVEAATGTPTTVEEFALGSDAKPANGKPTRSARLTAVANADKPATMTERATASKAEFLRKIHDVSKPEQFTVLPGTEHEATVIVVGLTSVQRSQARDMAMQDDGTIDGFVLECAYVHFGMIEPQFTIEELAMMVEGYLDPIYNRILDKTLVRQQRAQIGADEPSPLPKRSGFARFFATDTDGAKT